jgi:hypothetical protein
MKSLRLYAIAGLLSSALFVAPAYLYFNPPFQASPLVAQRSALPTAAPKDHVELEVFSDPVYVTYPGTDEPVAGKDGDIIPQGTVVSTGANGRGQLVYPGGTLTRLDANTRIVLKTYINQPQQMAVRIEEGRIWSRIRKLFGQESYQTETGTTVATVRGTSYGHAVETGSTASAMVLKGKVEVECTNETDATALTPDEKAVMDCSPGKGIVEQAVQPADVRQEWVNFNIRQDEKAEERFGEQTYGDEGMKSATVEAMKATMVPNRYAGSLDTTGQPVNRTTAADVQKKDASESSPGSVQNTSTPSPTGSGSTDTGNANSSNNGNGNNGNGNAAGNSGNGNNGNDGGTNNGNGNTDNNGNGEGNNGNGNTGNGNQPQPTIPVDAGYIPVLPTTAPTQQPTESPQPTVEPTQPPASPTVSIDADLNIGGAGISVTLGM